MRFEFLQAGFVIADATLAFPNVRVLKLAKVSDFLVNEKLECFSGFFRLPHAVTQVLLKAQLLRNQVKTNLVIILFKHDL